MAQLSRRPVKKSRCLSRGESQVSRAPTWDFSSFPTSGALAQHDDFVAERRDRLGELPGRASLVVVVAAIFLPVPAGEQGDFHGARGRYNST